MAPGQLVHREEKSFATLSVLFFSCNNALAHLGPPQGLICPYFAGKKYTEAEPKDFSMMDEIAWEEKSRTGRARSRLRDGGAGYGPESFSVTSDRLKMLMLLRRLQRSADLKASA
jgi:hypothetical protein